MDSHDFPLQPGQGELSGAVDLLAHHGLGDYYELFCKRPFPHTLQASKYVRNVLSESDIQKGEGMELEQVLTRADDEVNRSNLKIHEFPMETLYEAFNLRESSLRLLPKGDPGAANRVKRRMDRRCKDRQSPKHKRHKRHNSDSHRRVKTAY